MKKLEKLQAKGKKVVERKAAAIEKIKHLIAKFDITLDHFRSQPVEKLKLEDDEPVGKTVPAKKAAKKVVKAPATKSSTKVIPKKVEQAPVKKSSKKVAKT